LQLPDWQVAVPQHWLEDAQLEPVDLHCSLQNADWQVAVPQQSLEDAQL
jgi:hypothetical protein